MLIFEVIWFRCVTQIHIENWQEIDNCVFIRRRLAIQHRQQEKQKQWPTKNNQAHDSKWPTKQHELQYEEQTDFCLHYAINVWLKNYILLCNFGWSNDDDEDVDDDVDVDKEQRV